MTGQIKMTGQISETTSAYLEHVRYNILNNDWPQGLNQCQELRAKINNLVSKPLEEDDQQNHSEAWFLGGSLLTELCEPITSSLDLQSLINFAHVNKTWRKYIGLNPLCKSRINAAFCIDRYKEKVNTCTEEELREIEWTHRNAKEKEVSDLIKKEEQSADENAFNFINKFLITLEDFYKLEDFSRHRKLDRNSYTSASENIKQLPSPIIDLLMHADQIQVGECLHLMPKKAQKNADQLCTYILFPPAPGAPLSYWEIPWVERLILPKRKWTPVLGVHPLSYWEQSREELWTLWNNPKVWRGAQEQTAERENNLEYYLAERERRKYRHDQKTCKWKWESTWPNLEGIYTYPPEPEPQRQAP